MTYLYLLARIVMLIYGWTHRPPLILDCEAPCWYGIHPGKSDFIDVIRSIPFILERENVRNFTIRNSPVDGKIILSWYEQSIDRMSHVIFMKQNMIVDKISLPLPNLMSSDDLIKQYKSPLFFLTSYFPSDKIIRVDINYYFANGVVAIHNRFISYEERVFICPTDTISHLTYYSSDLTQVNLLAESLGLDEQRGENAIGFLKFTGQYGWLGWGTELEVPSEHGMYVKVIGQDISYCNFD